MNELIFSAKSINKTKRNFLTTKVTLKMDVLSFVLTWSDSATLCLRSSQFQAVHNKSSSFVINSHFSRARIVSEPIVSLSLLQFAYLRLPCLKMLVLHLTSAKYSSKMNFCSYFLLFYLLSPSVGLTPSGTYNPNVHGSDSPRTAFLKLF